MTQLEEIWDCIILILTELPGTTRRLSWGTASGPGHMTLQQQAGRPGVPATSEKQTICGPKDGPILSSMRTFSMVFVDRIVEQIHEIYRNAKTSWWLNQPI